MCPSSVCITSDCYSRCIVGNPRSVAFRSPLVGHNTGLFADLIKMLDILRTSDIRGLAHRLIRSGNSLMLANAFSPSVFIYANTSFCFNNENEESRWKLYNSPNIEVFKIPALMPEQLEIRYIFICENKIQCDWLHQEPESYFQAKMTVLCATGGKKKCNLLWVYDDAAAVTVHCQVTSSSAPFPIIIYDCEDLK